MIASQRAPVTAYSMFVQKINRLTGEADWVLVDEPGLGGEGDDSAQLVATSSYLDMVRSGESGGESCSR